MEGPKILRKDKILVQSHDQASKSLVLAQSFNSSQVLYQFVVEQLQQHHVILQLVYIPSSSKI